ncbi:hypothetical protein SAMN05192576_1845 [Nocardioides szechwanensis]|uniref:Uncharacterized protein n=1 Tax=Nocardioides szechwanensis TaxID=1005944 RepID=A0A1G9ZUT4_9ACTN|nr:hypothetical protein [Nocardioides szechwanensis]SDN25000.1 hypothetical protein SAMN05192576_1845 [Nocardioides szechwanensis]
MKTTLVALLLAVPLLASCGGDDPADTATDPAGSSGLERPTEVTAAPGQVRSANLATVMDTGSVELCLGPVAESYPPQCGGPAITNWDWADHTGMFEQQGEVRWGTFAVTGTWDGTSFTLTEAIPGALYDPMYEEPTPLPEPEKDYSDSELQAMAEDLGGLPGAQGAYADDGGHVLVDVIYDDGSFQDWADQEYGDDVVVIGSALVDVS